MRLQMKFTFSRFTPCWHLPKMGWCFFNAFASSFRREDGVTFRYSIPIWEHLPKFHLNDRFRLRF
jgi:hypothetical protein